MRRRPELFDVEGFDRKIDENRVLRRVWELGFVCLRYLRFACLTFGERGHGDVNVLEDAAGRYAENAFRGFDQIVTFASAMLAAEVIDEGKSRVELFCLNEKASAVRLPFFDFHWRAPSAIPLARNFEVPTGLCGLEMPVVFS